MKSGFRLLFVALVTLLASLTVARAHGPYDSSSQLIVMDGALELGTTLGLDGAKEVLLNAGLTEAQAADALASRGPSTFHQLSAELATRFFDVIAGEQQLKATRLRVITDGLEASFVATYPGTYSGEIAVHAHYFDGVEAMRPGTFVAMDENHNVKGSAILSSSRLDAAVNLGAVAATNAPVQIEAPAVTEKDVQPAPETEPVQPKSSSDRWFVAGLGALIVLFASLLLLVRKLRRVG